MKLLGVLCVMLFSVSAMAVDLDIYIGKTADYHFNGELRAEGLATVQKESVLVDPLNQVMTRYVFRNYTNSERPELASFTIYKNAQGQYFSYTEDRAYLRTPEASFDGVSELNPNKWVQLTPSGNSLSGVFYPNDLGEQKFNFEFSDDRIRLEVREWEQWFGMLPLPKAYTEEYIY